MNHAIHMTLTPISEAIEHARSMPNADVQLGVLVAHLKHRDEAIESLRETVDEMTRELEFLRSRAATSVVFKKACGDATPPAVQEFVATQWGQMAIGGGA